MDSFSIKMLALEILQTYGGYYVPLTTIFTGDVNSNSQDTATSLFGIEGGDQYTSGSIIGLAANAGLSLIRKAYDQGESAFQHGMKATSDLVADMCYGDDVASLAAFKDGSRYLGAGEMYYIPDTDSGFGIGSCGSAALTWAYDCQVPIFWRNSEDEVLRALKTSKKRAVVITDSQFGVFSSLLDELPGVMYRLDQEQAEWDFILFGVEWEVDESRFVLYKACSPVKAPTARYLGYIINENVSERISSASIDSILELHNSGRIYIASEKSEHSARVSSIFRTMPAIERACRSLAGFEPRFDRDYAEVQGNLFKGFRNSQVAFEMQVDEEQRVMFRSWGDSGGVNCECKLLPGMNGVNVEWLRYYEDNTVAFETTGDFVR